MAIAVLLAITSQEAIACQAEAIIVNGPFLKMVHLARWAPTFLEIIAQNLMPDNGLLRSTPCLPSNASILPLRTQPAPTEQEAL